MRAPQDRAVTGDAGAPAPHAFAANGLVYVSAWPVPGMRPAAPDAAPDLTIRPGAVSARALADAPPAGDCRLPGPGRVAVEDAMFRAVVEDGACATLDLAPGAAEGLAPLLVGYGLTSIALHQRGGLPLHAAAAAGPAGAVLLLAPSGGGKSTLAAALARRGWTLAGDDLIALEDNPLPAIHPAIRTVKLWDDSAAALGEADFGEALPPAGVSKAVRPLDTGMEPDWPAPLRAVVALDWLHPADAAPEFDRLRPLDALPVLLSSVHRPALAAALGREGEILARLARVAGAVPCFHLKRPRSFAAMARVLDMIETLPRMAARENA